MTGQAVIFVFFILVAYSHQSLFAENNREKRVFSLFNVVTFKNDGCSSSDSGRNGTCYTSTECQDKGGRALGNCAAGFGVCCVFVVSSTGNINQNCSYIQNPSFPSTYSETTSLTYTIKKCSDEVCSVRLDFDSFTIRGPAATTEADNGHNCQDSFVITGTSGLSSPTICGMNSGQHVYMDMGNENGNTATVSFTFSGTSTTRQWDIKVTQIPCFSTVRPPSGCLQYFTDLAGRIKSFNFDDASDQAHLASQEYTVCIRQHAGYCCAEYQLCSDSNSWSLDTTTDIDNTADLDTRCNADDHLKITGLSASCHAGPQNHAYHTKICGTNFLVAEQHETINGVNRRGCDCIAPFDIGVYTDANQESTIATTVNRGFCLEYNLIPCYDNN